MTTLVENKEWALAKALIAVDQSRGGEKGKI